MQIKNKSILTIVLFLKLILFNLNLYADEFNISAIEVVVDKKNEIVIGKGSVVATDTEGKNIKAEKITYEKQKEFLLAEGSVTIFDVEGNVLKTDKATYDKLNEIIISYKNSILTIKEGYELKSNKILYNDKENIISSNVKSTLIDDDGNIIHVDMFEYDINKNLFSSIGKIKIVDKNKNKYSFKELYVDTKKKEMIGSDISAVLDQKSFGVDKENDPRFVANNILLTKDKSMLSKGVFTVCKLRDDKCPPWSLKAKKITHSKSKKTIYYEHAVLKVYDLPIFYFPRFFHPDPTVKRKSGFLTPFISDSTSIGSGFGLPYFWAISRDKDLTFTPKMYANENVLLLNEYRQAFKNGFLTLDSSFHEGYKNTSTKKTDGSRNHIFLESNFNFAQEENYESNLILKVQKTSNDTYFRVHDINTKLVDADKTNLENKISYNFSKDDIYFNVSGSAYENLRKKDGNRYEYILPNIIFGKSFFSEKFGSINFKSDSLYRNYETNKHITSITNDISWNPISKISKYGFVNTLEGLIKNTNYDAENTSDHKVEGTVNEVSSVISLKSSLPMKKEGVGYSNIFSPNFMLRYAPGHMKDLRKEDQTFKYSDLFSINRTSVIENGLSGVLGFQFIKNKKVSDTEEIEKLSVSMGQVFNAEKNQDIPRSTSLDQRMSDVVGEINYNFSKISNIKYKFSLDHNFNDLNYNEVSTSLNFGKVEFNLDYLEEQNHVGNENYVNTGITLNYDDNNQFKFKTKKNFKTDSTELYDLSYQYKNDCLKAGLAYRRKFYEDSDIEPTDTLMFTITFVPFTGARTPVFKP